MKYDADGNTNCTWNNRQTIDRGTCRNGNKRTIGNHPNESIFKVGQNTEKSPGDLRRLAVTQTPVKRNQLTLV